MKQGFILNAMKCQACRAEIVCQPPIICSTEEALVEAVNAVHASSKLICSEPMIIATYTNCLISDALIEARAKAMAASNGNGHAPIVTP